MVHVSSLKSRDRICSNQPSTSNLLLLWQIFSDGLLLTLTDPLRPRLFFRIELELAHSSSQPLVDNARFDPDALLVGFAFAVCGLPPIALFVLGDGCDFGNGPTGRSAGVVR